MFQGLRKPKFTTKCKSYIKPIKTRLDTILKKKKAVQKYLKNDIAGLLEKDLDINAYGRAEGLLAEQSMTSCYEQIGTFCWCILEHIQALQTEKDCPDECKEAVQSLIYAAARFADLPELRSLRTLFTKKFGESDESCVNKEFVQKLGYRAFTREMKLQLLHDIATEHSVKWDSRELEKRLYQPPASEQEMQNLREQWAKSPKRESLDGVNRQRKWGNSYASYPKEIVETGLGLLSSSEDESSTDISSTDGGKACSSSIASVSEDEVDNKKRPFYYRFIPPPYIKQKPAVEATNSGKPASPSARIADKAAKNHCESPARENQKPISVRRKQFKTPPGHEDVVRSPRDGVGKSQKDRAKLENVRSKTQTGRKEERESGKAKAYDYGGESSRRRRPYLDVPVQRAEKQRTEDTPFVTSPKHPKLPDYDEFKARLAALRRNS